MTLYTRLRVKQLLHGLFQTVTLQPTTGAEPITDQNPNNQPATQLSHPEIPQNNRRGPRTEGIDPSNILDSQSRNRKPRQEAHLTDV